MVKWLIMVGILSCPLIYSSAISYELSLGRFADQAISYCHARYISYINPEISFLYRPFVHSDELALHAMHTWYIDAKNSYKKIVHFPERGDFLDIEKLVDDRNENILYMCHYFPETALDRETFSFAHFNVDWDDVGFVELLRNEIKPLVPIAAIEIPEGHICVAVHVRWGSGPDTNFFQTRSPLKIFVDKKYPLRFPPEKFYIDHIDLLAHYLAPKPLYVHVFTDHPQPAELVGRFRAGLTSQNVIINFRDQDGYSTDHDLEDFFGLTQFEYMIRPESHFSLLASKIGKTRFVIYPTDFEWWGQELLITEVASIEQFH